ncbi:head completion/stabilization protein [Enterovibrio sp. ZSDZ42]|uniref:Head completion/stabilization protein n=1 Tax=Enterovibrio gelatinilyticus TaxID=2899819 RepID=A0ABT5QWY6_9GAMM|nr:head completion/stabilization protein [Enterovibrio sp. ZSDZ42]MDD1792526.1 head completion/stabilization protein [Enterovibrio sp. ZSDZ42]
MSFGGYVEETESTEIESGGWPVLSTGEFRTMRRIPSMFEESSVVVALQAASLGVQSQLGDLLVDGVPPALDDLKTAVYERAVYGMAHADLLPEFATQDRKEAGENTAEDSFEQVDAFRTLAKRDISLLLGKSVNKVELI